MKKNYILKTAVTIITIAAVLFILTVIDPDVRECRRCTDASLVECAFPLTVLGYTIGGPQLPERYFTFRYKIADPTTYELGSSELNDRLPYIRQIGMSRFAMENPGCPCEYSSNPIGTAHHELIIDHKSDGSQNLQLIVQGSAPTCKDFINAGDIAFEAKRVMVGGFTNIVKPDHPTPVVSFPAAPARSFHLNFENFFSDLRDTDLFFRLDLTDYDKGGTEIAEGTFSFLAGEPTIRRILIVYDGRFRLKNNE